MWSNNLRIFGPKGLSFGLKVIEMTTSIIYCILFETEFTEENKEKNSKTNHHYTSNCPLPLYMTISPVDKIPIKI